jgi:GTP-binding protein EngB required for normal cell division
MSDLSANIPGDTTQYSTTQEYDHSLSQKKMVADNNNNNRLLGNRTSMDFNYRFKVILLGDSKVGKSSIVRRSVDETFNLKY